MPGALDRQAGASYPLDFCHFCGGRWAMTAPSAVGVYTDAFGFTYRLCAVHYAALHRGLAKAARFRPTGAVPRRPYRPSPRPAPDILRGRPRG